MTPLPIDPDAPRVLSIAGSDPRGAAGIQADLRTFALHGVYGCAAVTALTVQSDRAVLSVEAVHAGLVARQVTAVLQGSNVGAVKVGMLATGAVAHAVATALGAWPDRPIVIDPVLCSTSGTRLLDDDGLDVLRRELLPLATVLTPNAAEAGALLGAPAPRSVPEMRDVATALRALGPRWVLVTGGHVAWGDECVDVLAGEGLLCELRVPRVRVETTHGTGCTLSSAIAARLALLDHVPDACAQAQRFVAATLQRDDALAIAERR